MAAAAGAQRSRHAGCPGSITALRVDYGRTTSAFEPLEGEHPTVQRREGLRAWKNGPRFGAKPEWSSTVAASRFPDRAKMRLLSAHQSLKIEHNFRAQKVPQCYKDTVFVEKKSKFQADPVCFLTEEEKKKTVKRNVGGELSRAEFVDDDRAQRVAEKDWNISVQLEPERSALHRTKQYPDYRLVNKLAVTKQNYVSPERMVARRNKQLRTEKESTRAAAAAAATETSRPAMTMKNKDEWLALDPIKVARGELSFGSTST